MAGEYNESETKLLCPEAQAKLIFTVRNLALKNFLACNFQSLMTHTAHCTAISLKLFT